MSKRGLGNIRVENVTEMSLNEQTLLVLSWEVLVALILCQIEEWLPNNSYTLSLSLSLPISSHLHNHYMQLAVLILVSHSGTGGKKCSTKILPWASTMQYNSKQNLTFLFHVLVFSTLNLRPWAVTSDCCTYILYMGKVCLIRCVSWRTWLGMCSRGVS